MYLCKYYICIDLYIHLIFNVFQITVKLESHFFRFAEPPNPYMANPNDCLLASILHGVRMEACLL